MDAKEKTELLKYNIGRYDHYFDAINNKGNVYLALMTFLLGGNVTAFITADHTKPCDQTAWVIFFITLSVQLTGIVLTLLSLKPFLKSGTRKLDTSVLFFSDVATLAFDEFNTLLNKSTVDTIYEDAAKQAHQLAKGLCYKYKLLNRATYIIGLQILLIVVLGLLLIKKP